MGRAVCELTGSDQWDGGTDIYTITLELPQSLYNQIADRRETLEKSLSEQASQLMRRYPQTWLGGFVIMPEMRDDPNWRTNAKRWLNGETVNNQGRVRSDNVAPYTRDGLLFRSMPEVHLYQALKVSGLSFAPLPVFVRGGESYRRIEPDFLIFQSGRLVVIELDGRHFHQESPASAHARLAMLQREGAHIERIESKDCDTPDKAMACVKQIVGILEKLLENK